MRPLAIALVAALALPALVGSASAQDTVVSFSAPLYREMARDTQGVRSVSDLRTVPQPVHVPAEAPAVVLSNQVASAAAE